MCSTTYGWPALEAGSPKIAVVVELAERISDAAVLGNFLVDIFPLMNFLPLWMAPWKREGKALHDRLSLEFEKYLSDVIEKMVRLQVQRLSLKLTLLRRTQGMCRHAMLPASYRQNINMGSIDKNSPGTQRSCSK